MGKFKPVLFGAIFGGGLAFVALQYHLVRSDDGFRLVPRAPQPSIGLAFVDIRDFGMQEWDDRPELVQAITQHGSTDLIDESAREQVTNVVAPQGGTIDKVRSLLPSGQSDYLRIPEDADSVSDPIDLLSIPLTRNERSQPFAEIDQIPQPVNVARRELPSVDDIFQAGARSVNEISKPNAPPVTTTSSKLPSSFDSVAETEALEEMLFGYDDDPAEPPLSEGPAAATGVFEEISSGFEQRAADTFSRATTGLQNEATRTFNETTESIDTYLRGRVTEAVPESVSSMFGEDVPSQSGVAPALKAIQNGFDPFIR